MMQWNEADVCDVLGTTAEGNGFGYNFTIAKHGLSLLLNIYPDEGDVHLVLRQDAIPDPIFELWLIECPGMRRIQNEDGDSLEFTPTRLSGDSFGSSALDPIIVRVAVNPQISLSVKVF